MNSSDKVFYKRAPGYNGYPHLDRNLTTDILIVGAGLTGLSAAYSLGGQGYSVVLLEGSTIGNKTVGRSAGMLDPHGEDSLSAVPVQRAKSIYALYKTGLAGILSAVHREGIECQLQRRLGALVLSTDKKNERHLLREVRARARIGVVGDRLLKENGLRQVFLNDSFSAALSAEDAHAVNPLMFAQEFAQRAAQKGTMIFENTIFSHFDRKCKRAYTSTGAEIRYKKIIFTSGVSLTHLPQLAMLNNKVIPVASHIIVTTEVSPTLMKRIFPSGRTPLLWDCRHSFNYARLTPEKNLLFGGADVLLTRRDARDNVRFYHRALKRLTREFQCYFPSLGEPKVTHFWGGIIPVPVDGAVARRKREDCSQKH